MHGGQQPAFATKGVRRAFAMAIDREAIIRVAYKQIARIAHGMLPPELPGAGPSPPPIPYDPEQARKLLATAGYPGGRGFPRITLVTLQQTPYWQEACQLIRANLHEERALHALPDNAGPAAFLTQLRLVMTQTASHAPPRE